MQATTDTVQRVRIYLNDNDDVSGQPLYLAALDMLREAGATGATVLRGVAGFGSSQRLRTIETSGGRGMPIVIEWIDRVERVGRILSALDNLLPNALITIESVQVYRAVLRSSGPFGEQTVAELVRRDITIAAPSQSVASVVTLLELSSQALVPVLDDSHKLIGVLSVATLARSGLPTLERLAVLDAAGREALLGGPGAQPLATVVSGDMPAFSADSSILSAANAMVEWGFDELPIVGRDGRFLGLFGVGDALGAVRRTQGNDSGPIRNAETPSPISLLMQGALQTVLGYAPAIEALMRLVVAGDRPVIVVDNGRPLGMLDIRRLAADEPLRLVLAALFSNGVLPADSLGDMRTASLPLAPLPVLPMNASYNQAIAMLLDEQVPWLGVVDEAGKLQGLVGRRTILRALVQASAT